MEKNKRWHFGIIIAVLAITIYNILPTIFYYSNSMDRPIEKKEYQEISSQISARCLDAEKDIITWIDSLAKEIGSKIKTIDIHDQDKQTIVINFYQEKDAENFKKVLPSATSTLSLEHSKVFLMENISDDSKKVYVSKKNLIGLQPNEFFEFRKINNQAEVSDEFSKSQLQNIRHLLEVLSVSENADLLKKSITKKEPDQKLTYLLPIVENISKTYTSLQERPTALKRSLSSLTQGNLENKNQIIKQTIEGIEQLREKFKLEKIKILEEESKLAQEEKSLDPSKKEQLAYLVHKEEELLKSATLFKKNSQILASGKKEITESVFESILNHLKPSENTKIASTSLQGIHPLFESISYDWSNNSVQLNLFSDLTSNDSKASHTPMKQHILDEVSKLSFNLKKNISLANDKFFINFNTISNPTAEISIDLSALAQESLTSVKTRLNLFFHPENPIIKDSLNQMELFYGGDRKDYLPSSLYVVLKNGLKAFESNQDEKNLETFQSGFQDLTTLQELLSPLGFQISHSENLNKEDLVFEAKNFYSTFIEATRENFHVSLDQKHAILQLGNFQQRLHQLNKIETQLHNDLMKLKNDYFTYINHPQRQQLPIVVKPSKNSLISNIMLSAKKYFRGDERKILRWGLDLSGGKSVEVALYDHNNNQVLDEPSLRIASNELYERVNKLGVSEVSIRIEGDHITCDFPGSQDLSAQELIQATTMTFHLVNEKFSSSNSYLSDSLHRFLQDVWVQALVNKTSDIDSLNAIAKDILYGEGKTHEKAEPRTQAAKFLLDNGLCLDSEFAKKTSDNLICSKIAPVKIDSNIKNSNLANPLLVIFADIALEGSNLSNIHSGYDPQEGNYLSFEIKKTSSSRDRAIFYPQHHLASWTEKFSKDAIKGTEYEKFSKGHGYRMAVLLNGEIVSSPSLSAAIKESGRITGHFTQKDVQKLESDLKAGSLTFTPKILSERNISPELGYKERFYGILATAVALALVVVTMTFYYRFSGLIAAIAVLFNLLILWAVLQNIQATLTLAGLAGIVLTVGMAVDANVLVFERIKEEMKLHKNIKIALEKGYEKAFSAIVDSNLTTILAGLVLLNFDSGPVKGFAITLIIGVVSSMFTALFMTRFFFRYYLERNKLSSLNMMDWIRAEKIQFLKFARPAFLTAALIVTSGLFFGIKQGNNLFGMDFTGGYSVNVSILGKVENLSKEYLQKSLESLGISEKDISVSQLPEINRLKLVLSKNFEKSLKNLNLGSQNNKAPVLALYDILKKTSLPLADDAKISMEKSWVQVSGQMSETMRNQALIGILIALVGILIYIAVRFEIKYALAATSGLGIVVTVTLGLVSILNAFSIPLQIDLNMVAALLTIVGYSLNDTIIVFDRIREDVKKNPHLKLNEIANRSLNTTLSRTLLTSGTTLIVLLALVCLGGSSIFSFSFVMLLGVLIGTLSTFYCATPLLLYFEKKDKKERNLILA